MRTGAQLVVGPNGGDLVLGPTGIRFDSGPSTSILATLLSHARARPQDVEADANQTGRRGWWPDLDQDRFGSRLWTLARTKRTDETLRRAKSITEEALAYLVEDGIAAGVEVTTKWTNGRLDIQIGLRRGENRRWSFLWTALEAGTYDLGDYTVEVVALG